MTQNRTNIHQEFMQEHTHSHTHTQGKIKLYFLFGKLPKGMNFLVLILYDINNSFVFTQCEELE